MELAPATAAGRVRRRPRGAHGSRVRATARARARRLDRPRRRFAPVPGDHQRSCSSSPLSTPSATWREEGRRSAQDPGDEVPFVNFPEAVFTGCLLLFLAAMTLVVISHHWGLMWVAVEATTLASAPLIYFHRYPRSLEATWKYLVICSVGIALALLGNFFLAVAAQGLSGDRRSIWPSPIWRHMPAQLDPLWLKAAFLLLLVGYGTKMGLAPMHTWLARRPQRGPLHGLGVCCRACC